MLQRRRDARGVVFYVSPLLEGVGVKHAFSTRLGGISPPPFDSLNLGNPNGCEFQDDYDRIWQNYHLLHAAAGCSAGPPCRVHQVHGATVLRVLRGEGFDTTQQADALVSNDPTRVMSVRVADCVPVLLASGDGRRVAAIHAGWRGVVGGIALAALKEMLRGERPPAPSPGNPGEGRGEGKAPPFAEEKTLTLPPPGVPGEGKQPRDSSQEIISSADVFAAIGPCIGYDAFEVGPEVIAEFRRVFGSAAPCREAAGGKGFVDLREAIALQLISAGIPRDHLDLTDRCTCRDREEFFSHRRDAGVTGRMAAVIQAAR